MRPIRIAVQLHPQHGVYADLRSAVERVEELGADLLYTWDHFFPLYGGREGAHFECWTMLAAWAERDPRTIEWSVEPADLSRFLERDAEEYVALGFTQFTLGVNGPRWEIGPGLEDWLGWRDERNGRLSAGRARSAPRPSA